MYTMLQAASFLPKAAIVNPLLTNYQIARLCLFMMTRKAPEYFQMLIKKRITKSIKYMRIVYYVPRMTMFA